MNSIQCFYALQSITTIQPMQWHCYCLLYWWSNSKTNILFHQIRTQSLRQKYECNVFNSSFLSKLFFCPWTQQQTVYKSIHPFLTPYAPISMPHTLIYQVQYWKLLPFSLHKQCLDVHNMLHKACIKTCIILLAKQIRSWLHMLHDCWNSTWKWENTRSEAKRMVKIALFGHILKIRAHKSVWSYLLIHIRFTLSEGPKGFVNWFFEESDYESWTIKSDHGKGHLPWSDVMVHGVNRP